MNKIDEAFFLLSHDKIIEYHFNTKIVYKEYWINNRNEIDGEYKEWNSKGELLKQLLYKNGEIL